MYDQFAQDYDRFVNWENRLAIELPTIKKLVGLVRTGTQQPPSILDAGCGTGRHAIALAKVGYRTAGADLFTEMVQTAKVNAKNAGLQIPFEVAGFGKLAEVFGSEQFDAVLCLGNSLPHLLSDADLKNAIADFRDCLKPGGVLLIQNRNFDRVLENHERWMEPQAFQEDGEEWVFQRFYDFLGDGCLQFNIVELHRTNTDAWLPKLMTSKLKPIISSDLARKVEAEGFSEVTLFGSLTAEPFDPHASGNLVLFAYKT